MSVIKKSVFVIIVLVSVVYLTGCGKRQELISETQEPISIEELGKFDASMEPAPEVSSKVAPAIIVTPGSAIQPADSKILTTELPPAGPYKPTTSEIQTALKNAGYYTGLVDGKKGALTKKAVEDFQRANGLDVDGKVGPKTWTALSKYLNPEPPKPVRGKKRQLLR